MELGRSVAPRKQIFTNLYNFNNLGDCGRIVIVTWTDISSLEILQMGEHFNILYDNVANAPDVTVLEMTSCDVQDFTFTIGTT